MPKEGFRIMRLFVFFDLPVETSTDRKNYRKFRKFLIENGYAMVQYSVYAKIILNHSALNYQKKKVMEFIPKKGIVDLLVITEKQYANMERLVHQTKRQDTQITTTERIIEL